MKSAIANTRAPLLAGMVLFLVLCCGNQAAATILFFDDFNLGASSAWGNERGNWRDWDGVYDATNPSNNPVTYSGVTTLPSLGDFILDVDVNDLDDGGIWLRSAYNGGAINGVLLVTGGAAGDGQGLYWHTAVNGGFSPLLNPSGNLGLHGQNVHLRVEVAGNTYSAFVGGSPVAATTLTTSLFASGSVGLYDFSPTSGAPSPRGQTFDSFQVSAAIPEPGTLVLLASGLMAAAVWSRRRRSA